MFHRLGVLQRCILNRGDDSFKMKRKHGRISQKTNTLDRHYYRLVKVKQYART